MNYDGLCIEEPMNYPIESESINMDDDFDEVM